MSNKTDWLKLENRIRATPLDLLKQGVHNRQWEAVDAAYTMLTGETVFPSSPSPAKEKTNEYNTVEEEISEDEENEEVIEKENEDDRDEDEIDDDEEGDEDAEEGIHKHRQNKIRVATGSQPVNVKGKKNTYKDDGVEAEADLKLMPSPEKIANLKTKRRPTYTKVKVKCSKCGTIEKVDPILAPQRLANGKYKMRYVCNDCSCIGGRE